MADPQGKTILQLELLNGVVDRTKSYLEIHVVGALSSQRIALSELAVRGLSAKEVVQLTHPEIQTDEDFIKFISAVDGKSAYELAVDAGYAGTQAAWVASLTGTDGEDGRDGTNGKSAYELALDAGFVGTIPQWLATLKGTNGNDGLNGQSAYDLAVDGGFVGTMPEWLESLVGKDGTDGNDGNDGVNGKSAFELAVDAGFIGDLAAYMTSLKGSDGIDGNDGENGMDGKSAFELAVTGGYQGTLPQWLISLRGADGIDGEDGVNGKSAFELAQAGGFQGTEPEWRLSLVGAAGTDGTDGTDGVDGKSAYELAQEAGFEGDLPTYIASLKGAKGDTGETGADGKTAYQVAVLGGFVGTEAEWIASLKGVKGDTGAIGKTAVVGQLIGTVSFVEDLPPAEEYETADYFFINTNVHMNIGGSWVDLGTFEGPAGKDGTGITILGELPSVGFLPETGDEIGDAWLIGKAMFVWNAIRWQEQGQEGLKGEQGEKGEVGPEGKNSFETVKAAFPEIDTMAKYVEFIRGLKGDKGEPAMSFLSDGVLPTLADLPVEGTDNRGYLILNAEDDYEFHVWVDNAWLNLGTIAGPEGPEGKIGPDGVKGDVGRAMTPRGELATVGELPTEGNEVGDYFAINKHFHAWMGSAWLNLGDFSGVQGEQGIEGPMGSAINPKGEIASVDELPTEGNVRGDGYEVAGFIHVYGENGFVRMGPWRGATGLTGKSAYQAAVDAGFVGTQAAWLLSLKGEKGETGETGATGKPMTFKETLANEAALPEDAEVADAYLIGELYYIWNGVDWATVPALKGTDGVDGIDGTNGTDGLNGKTNYQLAQDSGFLGTQVEWLASLKGAAGKDGVSLSFVGNFDNLAAIPEGTVSQVATAAGRVYINNGAAWIDSGPVGVKGDKGDTGDEGKSAYELAVEGGFVGTVDAWLASLKGNTGATGKSLFAEAVESGAFVGTLPEFIAAQKGATGDTAYQEAIKQGYVPVDATFDDFMEYLRGPEGDVGPTGTTGPAISIVGTLATAAELPATGVVGTGYAIPDQASPGTYDCYIWLDETDTWFNLGHIVGSQGPRGDIGPRGLQGVIGPKGDQGSLWLVFQRNPQAQDGRLGDYYFNSLTQAFFRKTDAVTWAPLGFIGGGNLNAPAADGKIKGIKDGAWLDMPLVNTLPADETGVYQLVNGQWVKFDIYTLKVIDAANTIDWNSARQFRLTNTVAGARTIALTNIPAADRAATVVVKVYGKVAAFNWTIPAGKGTLRWFDGTAPAFTNDVTTIVFNWDGQELVGSVPN